MDPVLRLLEIPFVQEYIKKIGGEKAVDVIRLMVEMGNSVTDEDVAEKMGVKVMVVRAVYNRLHYWGIADYNKTRDEKTGWYTYTWYLVKDKIKEAVMEELVEREDELRKKKEELERFMFFECPEGHLREPFEVAMEYDFRCPECGKEMQPLNVDAEKKRIDEQLDQIWKVKQILSEF